MSLTRTLLVAILAGSGPFLFLDCLAPAFSQQPNFTYDFVDTRPGTPRPIEVVDNGLMGLPSSYQPSTSTWEAAEKARYRALLPQNSFDVLVVPFQVNGYALDRSTRSLMSAQLAMGIRQTGIRVPDPYPVLRALGESRRQFNIDEVYELAHYLGVKRVVWAYCGHDRNNHLRMQFRIKEAALDGWFTGRFTNKVGTFDNITFSTASPPIIAYQAVLPKIVEGLGFKLQPPPAKQASKFDGVSLPGAPKEMIADKPDPARDAYYFLTYAALTPASAQRARERFVEKAFLSTLTLAEDYPDYRLLRARTFMLMGMRGTAIQALGQPSSDEEKALAAMLNGNLPDVAAATRNIRPKLKRLLAELDLAAISEEYGSLSSAQAATVAKSLPLQGNAWSLFVSHALSDGDPWAQFDNLAVKKLLDEEFPVQGFTAEAMLSGAVTVSDSAKLRDVVDFSAYNHIGKVMQKQGSKWCCVTDPSRPSPQDYLDLVEAVSFDNLARRVNFLDRIQNQPQGALNELARFEAVYKGHPYFSLLRAQAEFDIATKADNATREGLSRSAYVNAFDAWYNAQGQAGEGASALRLIFSIRRGDFGEFFNAYIGDVPFRSSYPTWEYGNAQLAAKNASAALDNATIDTQPVYETIFLIGEAPGKEAEIDDFLNSIGNRFHGNSGHSARRGDIKYKLGDLKAAEAFYREGISSQPEGWISYKALAVLLFWDGRLQESAQIAKSWPGFAPGSAENPVGVANHAYEIGSNYYWNGSFELAKQFYEIAANRRTGADSSLAGESRIKLQAGDFAGAFKVIYDRATRYRSSPAYRDYLSFLQAMGISKESWDALNTLLPQQSDPYLWDSALVGHRRAAASDQEILAWASQDALRNTGEKTSYSAMYVLRSATMDRVPGDSIAATVGQLDREIWKVTGKDGKDLIVRNSFDGLNHVLVRAPTSDRMNGMGHEFFKQSQKTRLKSEFELFAMAYRLIRTGDYEGARVNFEEAFGLYDLGDREAGNYVLPYLAFAAARSKNTSGVEKILAGYRPGQQGFDFLLAQAVILGISGKTEDSIATIKKALYRRPTGETRPVASNYEYAEIFEWLFEATGKSPYRDLALDWARKNEKTLPWVAWPYAMDAKLSGASPERGRAIAMAYYLDRNSDRLKSVPKAEIDSAVKQFGPRNPFLTIK